LWDVKNQQWLDRIAFESKVKIDRLSPLDENRFVFGNTETLMLVEREVSSRLSTEHASRAVHFCTSNPKHPDQAYFRIDGFEGVCWIGSIPADGMEDKSKPTWFDLESNRLVVIPRPAAGCWSNDGTRLYVLDTKGNLIRYDFDPLKGVLSSPLETASVKTDSSSRLEANSKLQFINDVSLVSPQAIYMGIAKTVQGENGWSDEIYIGAIEPLLIDRQRESFAKPVHAVFHQNHSPNWLLDAGISQDQETFKKKIVQLFELINTNKGIKKTENQIEIGHKPNQVTCDAQGELVILQYPKAALFLSLQDRQAPRWHRLDRDFPDIKSFDLSPDAKTLAIRDKKSLNFYRVGQKPENGGIELEPIESPMPNGESVQHFAWDPQGDSTTLENSMRFACVLADNTVLYAHKGKISDLGKICSLQTQGEDDSEKKTMAELQASDVQRIWFFKEILSDSTVDPPSKKTIRYLVLQTIDKSAKPRIVRFIKLPDQDPSAVTESGNSSTPLLKRCVDLDLGQSFTEIVPNEQGGIIATGDEVGNVAVYLVSPFWEIANQIFDANSETDSSIEGLSFAEQGDTLVVSNSNNHLFGLRTKPTTPESPAPPPARPTEK
jgi:hypothetical protein